MFQQVLAGNTSIFASDWAREDGVGAYCWKMHCEFISGIKVTYGHALAANEGFHRVTTAEKATEVSPYLYL